MKQPDWEFVNFEKMMQRAVNAKAKTDLRSNAMVRDLDAHCPRSHCFTHATLVKVQTQGFNTKESKPKEFWPKELKSAKSKNPAPPHSEFTELGKTSRINKKKTILKKNETRKTVPWQLGIMPTPLKVKRRNGIIEAIGDGTIARKKAIF